MKWVRFLFVMVVLAGVGAGGAYLWFQRAIEMPGPLQAPVTIVIEPRSGVSAIARQLADSGITAQSWITVLQARRTGQDRSLKPGEYRFDPGMNVIAVLDKLVRHDVVVRFVTIPEGLVTAEIKAILDGAQGLVGDITAKIEDGDLKPETYRYEWGDKRDALVARMRNAREAALKELWDARAQDLPLNSPEEAVALASIVEKETGKPDERPRVAGVFINRLKRGMKLQSDPTVVYGLGRAGDTITYADLERPTPFNTYVIPGLPPSPICHPGRASLAAVLNPAASQDLYFVADGTGGHAFAASLDEHNRNVAQWRKSQRASNPEAK